MCFYGHDQPPEKACTCSELAILVSCAYTREEKARIQAFSSVNKTKGLKTKCKVRAQRDQILKTQCQTAVTKRDQSINTLC